MVCWIHKFGYYLAFLAMAVMIGCGGGGGGVDSPPAAQPLTTTTDPEATGLTAVATIGTAGGTLSSEDGRVTITVLEDAVAADTEFKITRVVNPAGNAVVTYKLEPEGLTFAYPVTLTFSAPDGMVPINIEGLGIAYLNEENHWEWLTGVSCETGNTLSVEIDHFSIYGMFAGYNLLPSSANVEVGESVQLQVVSCMAPDSGNPALESLVFECRTIDSTATCSKWSVDGTEGGNGNSGTVTNGGTPIATFTAPSSQPDPETVQVTVEVTDIIVSLTNATANKVVLFSLVTIGDALDYSGDFTVVTSTQSNAGVTWSGTGHSTWTIDGNEYTVVSTITPDQTIYDMGGDTTCVLNGATQTYENLGQIHEQADSASIYWLLDVKWSATCSDANGSTNVPNFIWILWASGCGNQWAPLDSSYPDGLVGDYTWSGCPAPSIFSSTVSWNLTKN